MRLPSLLAFFAVLAAGFLPLANGFADENSDVHVLSDVAYKSSSSLTEYEKALCKLDLYLPPTGQNFPVLVWFHGGALKGGSKDGAKPIAERFAHAGIAVVAVNYRLSPKATYPAYLDDGAAAVAWVISHATEQHFDPTRIFVSGHSAGGYLTYMIGLDDRWLKPYGLKPSAIAGLIPISGQTMTHYTVREERGITDHNTISADEAAPINHLHKTAPPMLILYADKDMAARAEENRYLAAVLRATGDTHVQELQINDRTHGSIAGDIAHPGDPAAEAILHFIADPSAAANAAKN